MPFELNRTELPSQIADGSRAHLSVDRDVARAIGDSDAQTQVIRAHALDDNFAVAPMIQPFQLSKNAVPQVAVTDADTAKKLTGDLGDS